MRYHIEKAHEPNPLTLKWLFCDNKVSRTSPMICHMRFSICPFIMDENGQVDLHFMQNIIGHSLCLL